MRFVQPEIKNAVFVLHLNLRYTAVCCPCSIVSATAPGVLSPLGKLHQFTLRPLALSYGAFDGLTEGGRLNPAVDGRATDVFKTCGADDRASRSQESRHSMLPLLKGEIC
jgi:hypothetical protein